MGYKQELLQKIEAVKKYAKLRQENPDEALKVENVLKYYEDANQVQNFFAYLNNVNYATENFGSREKYQEFVAKNQAIFKSDRIPNLILNPDAAVIVPDVDFEAVIDAIEESSLLDAAALEARYKDGDPKVREFDLPMTEMVESIKADADALFEEPIAKELKASLDFANGEMVEKLGKNLLDDAIEINSKIPMYHATDHFKDFVKSQGLDENVVVNHNGSFRYIEPNLFDPENINIFKPFLQMEAQISEDYQQKVKALDDIISGQGLLEQASGGESGQKEYGLMDYFVKQRVLKKALTDHVKLQTAEEKRESLIRIDSLAKETKEINARYEKVIKFIKENFDLDNVCLPGNVYSGRAGHVQDGNIDNWYPNLPPRYDFENAKATVFLNGFAQLKAACQQGDVTVGEYLANPSKTYLKAVENISRKEDAKCYLPRGEENPLGKRLARILVTPSEAYGSLKGYAMMGGRAMEFITNTNPNKESQIGNTIITNINKEYGALFNHHPDLLFGNQFEPQVDNIKNLFAFGDQEDDLYKVSSAYRDKDGNLGQMHKNYDQALKAKANVPVDQQYRNIMATLRDFALERKYMFDHRDQFCGLNRDGDRTELNAHSLGTLLAAGREYFEDYLLANNLSIASIQDDALREEVTSFITDPVGTLCKYVKEEDLANERLPEISNNFKAVYLGEREDSAKDFARKFNQFNQKPNGYNTGKSFTKCLDDNKGSWWERWRGKTSKQYRTLQSIARESARPGSAIPGDNKALYSAAKAYKDYKMPEGRRFEQLNSTEKRRIEFCDSIINAYEAQKREAAAQVEDVNQPQVDNNIIQNDFQNQLNQDLAPKQINNDIEAKAEPSAEKDPPESEGVQP